MGLLASLARLFRRSTAETEFNPQLPVSVRFSEPDSSAKRWDLFVSYASENRATALAIAESLKHDGLRVWFDRFEIEPGEPFADKILDGLDESNCAAVILCDRFLEKDWTRRELDILLTIEDIEGRQIVAFVSDGIDRRQLTMKAPALAARAKIDTANGLAQVYEDIGRVVRSGRNLDDGDTPDIQPKTYYPRFRAIGVVRCANQRCTWRAPKDMMDVLFNDPGPEFTFAKHQGYWYIVCDSCLHVSVGPVTTRDAKKVLALVRGGGIFAPDDSAYR